MSETIQSLKVSAFKVPTDFHESDGTAEWDSTTVILVELGAGKTSGLGYSYAHAGCVPLIRENLFPLLQGKDPFAISALWHEMTVTVRNFGWNGIASSAIAAVEIALWDLKSRLLQLPLATLLGIRREKIPVYGSGGFTSYSLKQLRNQFGKWIAEGISMVKMKIGRNPEEDALRVKEARKTIGKDTGLFVDANGAYTAKRALHFAEIFSDQGVSWFEEPVSSDDLNGLFFLRRHSPPGVEISAGEYNYHILQARRMLEERAVDVLQADATRCGITGFLQTASLCEAFQVPLSAHTAPAVHAHLCCAVEQARHLEYFHDHVRIEQLFFEGATTCQQDGFLRPDLSRPGLGLEFKLKDAEKYRINV